MDADVLESALQEFRNHYPVVEMYPLHGLVLECVQELRCGVEQRLARQAHNLEVAGSNPAPATSLSQNEREALSRVIEAVLAPIWVTPDPVDVMRLSQALRRSC